MQVADAVPLVDLEVAVVVPVVDAVAHVLAEGRQGRGELQDVVAVAQIAEVQVELEGVFDVHAGQADLLRQLQETGSLALASYPIKKEIFLCVCYLSWLPFLQIYLHVLVTGGVCAATLASLLGVAVDLALVAGLRRQRVLIRFSFLSRTTRAATEAQTRHTVPVGPTQTC